MTYIEFFDQNDIENVCSSLVAAPERIILIGSASKPLKKAIKRYDTFFRGRGLSIELIPRSLPRTDIQSIVEALSLLIEQYDDCLIDLTGGKELYLAAVGIVKERYPDKNLQLHHFNIDSGMIYDCDQDGKTVMCTEKPCISIVENMRLYGSEVVYDDVKENGTHHWDLNEEFKEDVRKMWEICKTFTVNASGKCTAEWNRHITSLGAAAEYSDRNETPLSISICFALVKEALARNDIPFFFSKRLMHALQNAGLLTAFSCDERRFSATFKNEQILSCLTKAGTVLELMVCITAMDCKDAQGTSVYNDVMHGVFIDWDGEVHTENDDRANTENEIDVMMMHGIVPVFVSCKNGKFDANEIYKLKTVARRFGGKYAKTALIVTSFAGMNKDAAASLRQRAKDENIFLLEELTAMDNDTFSAKIGKLWKNGQ